MKKIIACLLLSTMLFAAACQATPEKPVVVQKNTEKMLEQAKASEGEPPVPVAEQVRAPAEYEYHYASDDGKLLADVRAGIDLPDAESMPILRVRAADFTQEQVDAFYDALVGGTQMYQYSYDGMIKSDIESMIVTERENIAWLETAEGYSEEEKRQQIAETEDRIKGLEAQYETAPEAREEVPATSELKRTKDMNGSEYMGLSVFEKTQDENGGKWFSVQNNIVGENRLTTSANMFFSDMRAADNYGQGMKLAVDETTVLDPEIQEKIGLTPAEAKRTVEQLLQAAGAPMRVSAMEVWDDEQKGNYDGIVRPAEKYAYQVSCVRLADGIPCAELDGGGSSTEDMNGENAAVAKFWMYETLEFKMGPNGIFEMGWQSPLETVETRAETTALLPFDEIRAIFEKMIRIQYEARAAQLDYPKISVTVDSVRLRLVRVAEQNSAEYGLLVPAWCFFGTEATDFEGEDIEDYAPVKKCILIVNAVDGSVIDPGKGY